jgi:Alpha/beta hydrolase domain
MRRTRDICAKETEVIKPFALALLFLSNSVAQSRVTRIEVQSVSPEASGYEILKGVFHGEVDPAAPGNAIIIDIDKAPRNARGAVEYRASFQMARPVDATKSSGVLLYDVANRGNGAVRPNADGHLHVLSGWQGDIAAGPDVAWARVPVATGVTGGAMARFVNVEAGKGSVRIVAGFGRMAPRPLPVSLDTRKARLLFEKDGEKQRYIKPADWAFADCSTAPFPGVADGTKLCLKDGFDPAAAYTLGYRAKDPPVLGLGFAITRDLIAHLRSGRADDAGNANPARGGVRWAVATGQSQSGNFLRSFVSLGFNKAETGAQVFDGINPNIAARQLAMNIRFAVPGSGARLWEPGSEGTLWWGRYNDRARHLGTSSLLDRCTAEGNCPKVVELLGSAEFWGLRASPGFVGTDAKADIPLPANVRRYYIPSVTHGGSWRGGFPPEGESSWPGCVMPGNPVPMREQMRVGLNALIDWVRMGKEPPESRYPSLANGDLVEPTAKAMHWPAIPGAPGPDGKFYGFHDYDFGRGYDARHVSGVTDVQPPRLRRILPSRVPRVNSDGNETAGVPSVHLTVPLGTYTGWNVQAAGFGAGGGCGFSGGFIPFAKTKAAREANRDPRPSLEERYTDHAGFVAQIKLAVAREITSGWLMADDGARIIAEAEASRVLKD